LRQAFCCYGSDTHRTVIAADVGYFVDSILDFKWAFKKLPKSIPEALKKDLGMWLDEIFLAEGIDLINPNFLSALDFCFFSIKTKKKRN
jgi:hypothetical protein